MRERDGEQQVNRGPVNTSKELELAGPVLK